MVEQTASFPLETLALQVGYAGLLLYLTFRIFKLLDALVSVVRAVEIRIDIQSADVPVVRVDEPVKAGGSVSDRRPEGSALTGE